MMVLRQAYSNKILRCFYVFVVTLYPIEVSIYRIANRRVEIAINGHR